MQAGVCSCGHQNHTDQPPTGGLDDWVFISSQQMQLKFPSQSRPRPEPQNSPDTPAPLFPLSFFSFFSISGLLPNLCGSEHKVSTLSQFAPSFFFTTHYIAVSPISPQSPSHLSHCDSSLSSLCFCQVFIMCYQVNGHALYSASKYPCCLF